MDKRELKTKRNIKNAFLMLRSRKPIEKITVKELAEEAEISKATFYLHYKDIYDLSDCIGLEIIENILKGISNPQNVLEDPARFTEELANAFVAQQSILEIVFSGSQQHKLIDRIEESIKDMILQLHPEYENDIHFHLQVTYNIKGCYYAFQDYVKKFPTGLLIKELCQMAKILS